MEIWLILPAFLPRVLQGCASGSRLGGGCGGCGGAAEKEQKSPSWELSLHHGHRSTERDRQMYPKCERYCASNVLSGVALCPSRQSSGVERLMPAMTRTVVREEGTHPRFAEKAVCYAENTGVGAQGKPGPRPAPTAVQTESRDSSRRLQSRV